MVESGRFQKTLEWRLVRDANNNPQIFVKAIVAELASSGLDVSKETIVRSLSKKNLIAHTAAHQTVETYG